MGTLHRLIALLLLPAALSAQAPAPAEDPRPPQAVPEVLEHPLAQGTGLDVNRALRLARDPSVPSQQVVKRLEQLGTSLLVPSLCVLGERKLPPVEGGRPQVLSELQEEVLLDSLRGLNARVVWNAIDAHLDPVKNGVPTVRVRAAAILVAGTCARPEELRRLATLALEKGEAQLDPAIERALRIASEDVFRRNPEGLERWTMAWRDYPAALLPVLARGAGAGGDPRALTLLSQLLEAGGDLEAIALAELARQRAPREMPAALGSQLRQRLDPSRPQICQSACNALSALGDYGSVEALVVLLADDSPAIRATAHRALCNLSGLNLPAQPPGWHAWRAQETAWYAKRAPTLERDLQEGAAQEAQAALNEISLHRWRRHELSDFVQAALQRPEPVIRVAACQVLAALGSPRACKALEDLASSGEGASTGAARTALAALTLP